jgi:hypothetical protein
VKVDILRLLTARGRSKGKMVRGWCAVNRYDALEGEMVLSVLQGWPDKMDHILTKFFDVNINNRPTIDEYAVDGVSAL